MSLQDISIDKFIMSSVGMGYILALLWSFDWQMSRLQLQEAQAADSVGLVQYQLHAYAALCIRAQLLISQESFYLLFPKFSDTEVQSKVQPEEFVSKPMLCLEASCPKSVSIFLGTWAQFPKGLGSAKDHADSLCLV